MFRFKAVLMALAIAALITGAAFAQTTASLSGTVTSDGKPLPGVTVTITSPQMQGSRTAVTGVAGGYNFAALPPGTYTVQFALEGMSTVKKTVRVALSETPVADADMKVSAVSEAITVSAATPAVLEMTQVASNVTQKTLNQLPAGRNIAAAVGLSPGVAAGVGGFSISGASSAENLYMIDGVNVTENVRGQPHNLFIEDAIQETTTITASVSAEYGRFSGGVVNTITKSGGNEFSGTLRDTLTNPKWVAKTPFATEANHLDQTSQIDEATLGGYAIKDRLWFFGAGRKAKTNTASFTQLTALPYSNADNQKRFEGKLTGQITPKHSIIGTYIKINETEFNNNFNNQGADLESLVPSRQLPNDLKSLNYTGVITSNLLLEANASKKYFAFVNAGSPFSDFVHGTLVRDTVNGVRLASPTFCGVCDTEQRNNEAWAAKSSYFLNTSSMGTHSLVAGVDSFTQLRFANNHQSGSDYRVLTGVGSVVQGGNIFPVFKSGVTQLVWTAIFNTAQFGHFNTDSAYVNDKWDINPHITLNVGGRFDKNHAVDGNGLVVSNDSAFSPRLALNYDLKANGRSRVKASYARYVTALPENIGESFASVGQPAYIAFLYTGPDINTDKSSLVDKYTALQIMQNWFFNTIGGPQAAIKNSSLKPQISVPGFSTVLSNNLVSPHADEYTLGFGQQLGNHAFAQIDYVHRDFKDYFGNEISQATGNYTDPFGNKGDLATIINDPNIRRTYRAIQFQSQYTGTVWSVGTSYTYAHNEGNTEVETAGSGPVSINTLQNFYPEILNYAQRLPFGRLSTDIRNRLRLWGGYDLPVPALLGRFNVSALHQFNSGIPYSAVGTIDPAGINANFKYAGSPAIPAFYTLSQYSTSQSYFFGKRGQYQTPGFQETDLSLNWEHPISRAALYAKGEALNVFNRHADLAPNTTVLTARNGLTATGLTPFNPFTTTDPVECPQGSSAATCKSLGANWQKGVNFGKPTSPNAFQTPRTYRVAVGLRF